jgi:hypothetical protein
MKKAGSGERFGSASGSNRIAPKNKMKKKMQAVESGSVVQVAATESLPPSPRRQVGVLMSYKKQVVLLSTYLLHTCSLDIFTTYISVGALMAYKKQVVLLSLIALSY